MAWFFHKTESKSVVPADWNLGVLFGTAKPENVDSYSDQVTKALKLNPYVYKCTDLRASAVASIDFILYDKGGNEVADPSHPLRKLLSRPNPHMTWRQFAYEMETHLSLNGNAYILCEGDINGITALHLIPPDRVIPMPSDDVLNPIAYYQLNLGSSTRQETGENIIHIHGPLDTDQLKGVSPLIPAALSIEAQTEARAWNTSMMRNGAKPSMTVVLPDRLPPAAFQQAIAKLRAEYGGPEKAGKVAMFDGGAQVDYSGFNAHDMDYTAGITQAGKEICLAMGVPPEKAGDSASKTFSNSQEASREFALNTIVPQLAMIYDALTVRLCRGYADVVRIGYDAGQLEGMKADESSTISALTSCDYLTTNEKRARLSYESVDDGDVVLTAMGKVPLSEVASDPDDLLNDNRNDRVE